MLQVDKFRSIHITVLPTLLGNKVSVALLAYFVEHHNVGMGGNGSCQAGLPKEAVQVLGVAGHVGMENLKGDGSTQLSILSPVDDGKSAGADGLQDIVAADAFRTKVL